MIRALWVALAGSVYTLVYGLPILWRARGGGEKLRRNCRECPRAWSRRIVKAAGVEVTVEGAEHLSPDRPAILVANHQSWFDVWALSGFLPVDYRFVAKKELEGIPIFSPAWKACGHISIDRSDRQKAIASLQKAGKVMREEHPTVIMFPEGTRSPTGKLQPFKKGAFVLAIETGVQLLPAAILGTRDVMPKGEWRMRPGKVRVRIGAPIPVAGMTSDDRDALTQTAYHAIDQLMQGAPLAGPWHIQPRHKTKET